MVQYQGDMSAKIPGLYKQFMEADAQQRDLLCSQFTNEEEIQNVVDHFCNWCWSEERKSFQPKHDGYRSPEEMSDDLALLVIVSPYLEPRDIGQLVGDLCERVVSFPKREILEALFVLQEFLNPTYRDSHVGVCSTRSLFFKAVNEEMNCEVYGTTATPKTESPK